MELERALADHARTFPRRVAVATVIVIAITGVVAIVGYAIHAFLILFCGVLMGIFIDGLTRLAMKLRIGHGVALTFVLTLLLGAAIVVGLLVMPRSFDQATSIFDRLPGSVRVLLAHGAGATDEEAAEVAATADAEEAPREADQAGRDQAARDDASGRDQAARDDAAARDQAARDDASVRDRAARDDASGRDRAARDSGRVGAGRRGSTETRDAGAREAADARAAARVDADGGERSVAAGFPRDEPRGQGGQAVDRAAGAATEPLVAVPGQAGPAARQHPLELLADDLGALARPLLRSVTMTLSALGTFVVIAFMGLYFAARPAEYVEGLVRLMPPSWRDRAREVLTQCGSHLRKWMLGTGIAMLSAGVLTGVGLWLLGLPYALALGILAGLAEVIPNVGPIAAAIPAMLLTLGGSPDGGETASWWHVGLFYLALQTFQSYVIQPLAQRYMVDVPPALSLGALVLLGWLWGGLGLFAAVPIVVIATVVVKLVYLRDALGESPDVAAEG